MDGSSKILFSEIEFRITFNSLLKAFRNVRSRMSMMLIIGIGGIMRNTDFVSVFVGCLVWFRVERIS